MDTFFNLKKMLNLSKIKKKLLQSKINENI